MSSLLWNIRAVLSPEFIAPLLLKWGDMPLLSTTFLIVLLLFTTVIIISVNILINLVFILVYLFYSLLFRVIVQQFLIFVVSFFITVSIVFVNYYLYYYYGSLFQKLNLTPEFQRKFPLFFGIQ